MYVLEYLLLKVAYFCNNLPYFEKKNNPLFIFADFSLEFDCLPNGTPITGVSCGAQYSPSSDRQHSASSDGQHFPSYDGQHSPPRSLPLFKPPHRVNQKRHIYNKIV